MCHPTASSRCGRNLPLTADSLPKPASGLLSDGAQILMPMAESFFATRFGQLRDKFGTSWMITAMKPTARRDRSSQRPIVENQTRELSGSALRRYSSIEIRST
jgi:hypothetical protein